MYGLFVHCHHSHKNKERFLKEKRKGKRFLYFMAMPSFKQVEANYDEEEPCERGCSWIVKFYHCLNFGYRKYGIIFLICTICKVNNF